MTDETTPTTEKAHIAARIISPACDDLDHIDCGERLCGCQCHEGRPCGHTVDVVHGCGGCDPAASALPCWRSECRTGCYYPTVCSEKPVSVPEPCVAPPGNLCTETGCWDADRCVVFSPASIRGGGGHA